MNGKISTIKRRRAIYDRYVSGDSVTKIAEEFGLAQATVMGTVSKLKRHEEQAYAKLEYEMRVRETNMLERASDEVWNAWINSKKLLERTVETEPTKDGGEWQSVKERKTNGDPTYLREFRQCRQAISELWGLNAPTKIESTESVKQVEIREVIVVTRDDIARAKQIDLTPEENQNAITDATSERRAGIVHVPLHEFCEERIGGIEGCHAEATIGSVLQPMEDSQDE